MIVFNNFVIRTHLSTSLAVEKQTSQCAQKPSLLPNSLQPSHVTAQNLGDNEILVYVLKKENSEFSPFSPTFLDFSLAKNQTLLLKKIISKLKVSVIHQRNDFFPKNRMILNIYIVTISVPGKSREWLSKFREFPFPEMENFREFINPSLL